jgi:hypothetical protein
VADAVSAAVADQLGTVIDDLKEASKRLGNGDPAAMAERVGRSMREVLSDLLEQAGRRTPAYEVRPLPREARLPQSLDVVSRELPAAAPNTRPQLDDSVMDAIRRTMSDVQASAVALQGELVRLRAFRGALAADMPTVAAAVDNAATRAQDRLAKAAEEAEDLRSFLQTTGDPADLADDVSELSASDSAV